MLRPCQGSGRYFSPLYPFCLPLLVDLDRVRIFQLQSLFVLISLLYHFGFLGAPVDSLDIALVCLCVCSSDLFILCADVSLLVFRLISCVLTPQKSTRCGWCLAACTPSPSNTPWHALSSSDSARQPLTHSLAHSLNSRCVREYIATQNRQKKEPGDEVKCCMLFVASINKYAQTLADRTDTHTHTTLLTTSHAFISFLASSCAALCSCITLCVPSCELFACHVYIRTQALETTATSLQWQQPTDKTLAYLSWSLFR